MSSAIMEISMEIPQKKFKNTFLTGEILRLSQGAQKLHVPGFSLKLLNECFCGKAAMVYPGVPGKPH